MTLQVTMQAFTSFQSATLWGCREDGLFQFFAGRLPKAGRGSPRPRSEARGPDVQDAKAELEESSAEPKVTSRLRPGLARRAVRAWAERGALARPWAATLAREKVPTAEEIKVEEGAVIVASKDAAAVYVEGAVPEVAPSPRMPTGRVRVVPSANEDAARQHATLPSIAKGGVGTPLPRIPDELDTAMYTATKSAASTAPTVTTKREVRPKVGEISIHVNKPDADVLVDGVSVGRAPLTNTVFVMPGSHVVEARLGKESARGEVSTKGGDSQDLALKFASDDKTPSPPSLVPVLILGSLAVASFGAGIGFTVAANDKGANAAEQLKLLQADAGRKPDCSKPTILPICKGIDEQLGEQDVLQNAATGMWIGAGVLTAGTVAWWLLLGRAPQKSGVLAVPFASAHEGGALVQGRF